MITETIGGLRNLLRAMRNSRISRALFLLLSVLLLTVLAVVSTATAQSYSWEDAKGRTFYGGNPPTGSKNVKQLNTPKISRYSSDKVLTRLGWEKEQKAVKLPQNSADKVSSSLPLDAAPAELTHLEPVVSFSEDNRITACSVEVKNSGGIVAHELSVAFEFFEGTLIPAQGAESIEPGESKVFSIPADLLPLKLQGDPKAIEGSAVKVILHGASPN